MYASEAYTKEQREFFETVRKLHVAAFQCREAALKARIHIAPAQRFYQLADKFHMDCLEEERWPIQRRRKSREGHSE